ncbi:hypothetical protein CTI14_41605, partial [Methylobacterium radiotolerans]
VRGNFWGIPVNFAAFAAISITMTIGTVVVFGQAITDPALIIAKVPDTAVLVVGAVMFIVATIGVNVVLNFVSPAYDLANVWPKHITMLLNYCDVHAVRHLAQGRSVRGNFWGIPVNFAAFAAISITMTIGTVVVFGQA